MHSYFTATSEKGYIFLPFFEEMSSTYLGVTTMKKTIALLITLAFFSVISSALSQEPKEEKAITALQSALDKDPGNLNLLSKLGLVFLKKEKYQQAIEPLEKSIQLQKNDSKTHLHLSLAYGAVGRHLDKLRELQVAVQLAPDMAEANFKLSLAYAATNAIRKPASIIKKPSS